VTTFKGKRAAIYARATAFGQTLYDRCCGDQVARAGQWIKENGCRQAAVFTEIGTAIAGRPALQEMLDLAETDERPIDMVFVTSLSRLSRDASDFLGIRDRLTARNVEIVSIEPGVGDRSTDNLSASLLAIFGEHYLNDGAPSRWSRA
jgi:DNA invertase Pin-like site-specific DNA recombinase